MSRPVCFDTFSGGGGTVVARRKKPPIGSASNALERPFPRHGRNSQSEIYA